VKLQRQASVLTATLDSPPANAIGEGDLQALEELLASVVRPDSDVRALVFTGEGRFFAAGVDLKLVRANIERPEGADLMAGFIERLQAAYATIESLPLPTICAMNGGALGGGFELALACDLRIAADDGRYGLPEVQLGLLPGAGGTQRLTRLGGRALALRLIMRGESITGSEAERLGLVHWALPVDAVQPFAADLAAELAGYSTVALTAIKKCIGFDNSPEGYRLEVETTRMLMDDPDAREGLRKFFSRAGQRERHTSPAGR
jgi:enoyl-CoA hydratase/carnithine racemase